MTTTRDACVLAPFTDHEGSDHAKGDVFSVAYETDRQRQAVNQLIHRGFLTFEVKTAQHYLGSPEGSESTDPEISGEVKPPAPRSTSRRKPKS